MLKNNPQVEYAEPDYEIQLEATPNDPYFGRLYGMNKISAPQAWDKFTGSSSVIVGLIDSGIDYNHTDLRGNMWINPGEVAGNGVDDDSNGYIDDVYGWDFINNDNDPMDDNGHGTHCAGTIAGVGNNGIGVAGVAWQGKLAALKIANSKGSLNVSNAIKALNYANTKGFPITSNSWGGPSYSQSLKDTINASTSLFIAAAGNNGQLDNDIAPTYPASYNCDNIISVAATDSNDNLPIFSHYGKTSVDLSSPGADIWSCSPGNSYKYLSGTSMATPFVAGAAALLKGYKPNLSRDDIKNRILKTIDLIPALADKVASGGRLNVNNLLSPRISLKTSGSSTAKYVCAENGGGESVVVDRDVQGEWEIFTLIDLGNNKFALKSSNGHYLCAENGGGGKVIADRTAIGSWETFTLNNMGNNRVSLQADNGKYLCAENGGGGDLVADRDSANEWEIFIITYLN